MTLEDITISNNYSDPNFITFEKRLAPLTGNVWLKANKYKFSNNAGSIEEFKHWLITYTCKGETTPCHISVIKVTFVLVNEEYKELQRKVIIE